MPGIFDFLKDAGNYESRKVERTEVSGLIVDTCYTSDEGYETAIIDQNGAYPVERYDSKELAIIGHEAWCDKAKTITEITELGWLDLCDEEKITLQRIPNET